jgi:hypothetical protein
MLTTSSKDEPSVITSHNVLANSPSNEAWMNVCQYIMDRLDGIDRELTVTEAATIRGVSVSLMRKRIAVVPAWREAFFISGSSKELRTTIRRLRLAEDKLTVQSGKVNPW